MGGRSELMDELNGWMKGTDGRIEWVGEVN